MTEGFAFQASYKFGPSNADMLNVRANTAEEFGNALRALYDLAGTLVLAGDTVRASAVGGQSVGAGVAAPAHPVQAPVPQSAPQWAQPMQAQPAPAPVADVPHCAHGQRTHFKSQKGWEGWFCALPKGTPGACEPLWPEKRG